MVETIKFSEFMDGGDLEPNQTTVGLESGNNVRFSNSFPLLPVGSTAERPTPSPSNYYRLRFNTTLQSYEYYSSVDENWVQLSDTINVRDAPFIVYRFAPLLPNSFNLSDLGDGILKQTVSLGESTPELAVKGTDYYAPGNTIPIVDGGTGATTASSARTNLGLGSMAVQNSTSVNITGGNANLASGKVNSTPVSPTDITNKAYVDSLDSGSVKSASGTTNQINVDNTNPQHPVLSIPGTFIAPGTVRVGNLLFNGNAISSVNTNGNINIYPGLGGIVDFFCGDIKSGDNRNNATFKYIRHAVVPYDNSQLPFAYLTASSDLNESRVTVGGGTLTANSATKVDIKVSANTTTIEGSEVADFMINGMRLGAANSRVTTILNDSTMTSASSTNLYTGGSIKSYIDSKFTSGLWTPVFTFETPGDLSVVYTSQYGSWNRSGNIITLKAVITLTPTFTTSSGAVTITGIPFVSLSGSSNLGVSNNNNNISYGGSRTFLLCSVLPTSNLIRFHLNGSSANTVNLSVSNIISGAVTSFILSVNYTI